MGRRNVSVTMAVMLGMGVAGLSTGATNDEDAASAEAAPVVRLGEIVVTAGDEERNVLLNPTLESASLEIATSTVDSEMMTRFDATVLTEALEIAPGVFTETRGRKEKQLSSFRGQLYPYPDYAFNSVWQRQFWELPCFFPAIAIDRVEILRSGGAIMVGPNSGLVGAINLVPRRFDEETWLLDVQAGSYGTWRASLLRGDRLENGDYTVGVSSYSTDGPDGENAAEHFHSAFGTVGWLPYDRMSVELTAFGMVGERELRTAQDPGLLSLQNQAEEFSPMTSYGAVLRTLYVHQSDASTELSGGYIERRYDNTRIRPGQPEYTHDDDDWEYNLGLMHSRALSDDNVVRIGLQYNHWVSPDGKRFFVGNRMDVETFSVVAMDEHRWEKLEIDGGVRATRSYYHDYVDTTFNVAGQKLTGRAISDEWADPAVTGTLGAKYRVDDDITLYSHAAVGRVDAPPGAVSDGAAGLDAENRTLLDGGVRLGNERVGVFSAGLFVAVRDSAVVLDATQVTEDGDTFNTYLNKDIRQYGLELEARSARITNTLRLFCSLTVMESEQASGDDWNAYREIPNTIAEFGVLADYGRLDFSIFGKYVGKYENKRFAENGEYQPLGDFVDLNVTAGVTLNREKAARVYVSLENVLDDEYSTVVGYPDYGFQVFAGIRSEL